ncbi:uncharacterized protein BCR38DRAFT_435513 [Pseudomassariella vexata]|uniref:Uncharacterized protein n=1 Tax=Pseudomassariella vexata TaxID=1141098 RepID=A0A1Y2DUK6_9PEZI|nr:uncharacterized protein BCR38DRAFT_435513 [Pseudomassariella vexata]ORY62950.1 hypothetical protein BCR38DRAFT_435513 [Pseudomassariella vexata]
MLEKTAASLEPCGLLLPLATKSFRSRRQLHTAFWQHGAAGVELSNAWQALMHGVFNLNTDSPETKNTSLRASSFLLDFLYPNVTVAFMRRFGPAPGHSFAKVSPRLYSSSATSTPLAPSAETKVDESHFEQKSTEIPAAGKVDASGQENAVGADIEGATADQTPAVQDVDAAIRLDDSQNMYGHRDADHVEALVALLTNGTPDDADQVWRHYRSLDEQSKAIYLGQTLVFLSKTGSVTDSWKISELFQQIDPTRWDSYTFVAGLTAEMNLQNEQRALEIFAKGLSSTDIDVPSLIEAFDLLLASAIKSSTTDLLNDLWKLHNMMAGRWEFESITSQLSRVAMVSGLPEKILALKSYFEQTRKRAGGKVLRRLLVRRALANCSDDQVLQLLSMTHDHLAFEEFLRHFSFRGRRRNVPDIYRRYRSQQGCQPSHAVLHTVFTAYIAMHSTSAKLANLERLWGDWHRFHGQPTRRAYQKFLGFYAAEGDKERVYKLWTDYMELYADLDVIHGDDTFAHLLQVHAVREEIHEVQKIFNDIKEKFGIEPNRHCWNILLNAKVKTGDYDGSIATFEEIAQAVGADQYTYGTLMQMAASRGDLGFTVDLYRRARRQEIHTNSAMLGALVEAYCHNDHFHEAEDVCVRAAKRGIKPTRVWNKVLHAYALRRNLTRINRLLSVMTNMEVPYDHHTYNELLLGLSLSRQSQHALQLLAVAIKESAFLVTADHFHTLLGAFIKTGESDIAFKVHKLMQQVGFASSATSIVGLATAFGQWQRLPPSRQLGASGDRLLRAALEEFCSFYDDRKGKGTKYHEASAVPQTSGQLLDMHPQTFQFGRMIYLFTQMKDFMTVKKLVGLYQNVYRINRSKGDVLPVRLLSSIMLADWHEGQYDRVQETWGVMFGIAKRGALSADWSDYLPASQGSRVSPEYQYVLSDGLKIMQELRVSQGDLAGLRKLVADVLAAGFKLNSRSWNMYVQGLVKLNAYKEAFEVCEKYLMPNWTGWYVARAKANMKNKISLDARRRGMQPRHLRPTAHTFYYLVRGYIELDKMSTFSPEANQILKHIEEETPQTHRAVTSMILVHSDVERDILSIEGPRRMTEELEEMDDEYGEEQYGENEKQSSPRQHEIG